MTLPNLSPWTALVVVAGIAGVCALIKFNVDPQVLGAYSIALVTLAASLAKLFPGPPGSTTSNAADSASKGDSK